MYPKWIHEDNVSNAIRIQTGLYIYSQSHVSALDAGFMRIVTGASI